MSLFQSYLKKIYNEELASNIRTHLEFYTKDKNIFVDYNNTKGIPLATFINKEPYAIIWNIIKPRIAEGATDTASVIEYINNEFSKNESPFDVIIDNGNKVTINRETRQETI